MCGVQGVYGVYWIGWVMRGDGEESRASFGDKELALNDNQFRTGSLEAGGQSGARSPGLSAPPGPVGDAGRPGSQPPQ